MYNSVYSLGITIGLHMFWVTCVVHIVSRNNVLIHVKMERLILIYTECSYKNSSFFVFLHAKYVIDINKFYRCEYL